jgi:hypothetical protein
MTQKKHSDITETQSCKTGVMVSADLKNRIIEKDNRFYPQYFDNGIFGLFKGWKFYKDEELWLNGIYTFSTECDLSYPKLEWAIEYLENLNPKTKVVYEKH